MTTLFFALVGLLCMGSVVDEASDPEAPATRFTEANHAYEAGHYGDAIATYETLGQEGYGSGWIDYNLGNSYLRDGELGKAIAHFRRSQAELPRNGDVRANLVFARQRAQDAMAPPEPTPWQHTLFFWHYALSLRELIWCVGIVNLLAWSLFVAARLRPRVEALRWGFAMSCAALVATGASLSIRCVSPVQLAVATLPELNVHSGTSRDTVVRFKLHAGTEMRVLDTQDDWARIELSDGKQGWVKLDDVTTVQI